MGRPPALVSHLLLPQSLRKDSQQEVEKASNPGQAPHYCFIDNHIGKDAAVHKHLRFYAVALVLATAVTVGALATNATAAPADTTWGVPAATDDTTWGTPPANGGEDDPTPPQDTTWG